MKKNTLNLLLCELSASSSYIQRIFLAILEVPELQTNLDLYDEFSDFYLDFTHFVEDNLLLAQYRTHKDCGTDISVVIENFKNTDDLITSFLKFRSEEDYSIEFIVSYINLLYEYAHSFHQICDSLCEIDILFPRSALVTSNDTDFELPKFSLDKEMIYKFKNIDKGQLEALDFKRTKKYETLISEGHKKVFDKEFDQALDLFKQANKYKETPEALTLVGWAYSLLNDLEKAKSYCVKAIKVDPDYGPPYNDIGSYLLIENKVNDSLKWFKLAKKASVYQNREYPYINSGRAYLSKNEDQLALDEFSMALTLAPYHTELHETVEKLKINLDRKLEKEVESNLFSLPKNGNTDNIKNLFNDWT